MTFTSQRKSERQFASAQSKYDNMCPEDNEHISEYYSAEDVPEEFKSYNCPECMSDLENGVCYDSECEKFMAKQIVEPEVDWDAFEERLKY